jgi:ABC-2 type transport system permease protein
MNTRDAESPFANLGTSTAAPLIVAAALLLTSARWWLATPDRTALAFTPAEVHLLFPAPVSRRALVQSKLLRGQVAILLNVVVWVVLLRGGGGSLDGWQRGIALWILFSTFTLHRLAAALVRLNVGQRRGAARGRARSRSCSSAPVRRRRLRALAGAPAITAAWAVASRPCSTRWADRAAAADRPLRAAARAGARGPVFAVSGTDWLWRIGPALLVLALHYLWVVRTDAAFEEAALEASQERAKVLAKLSAAPNSRPSARAAALPASFPATWGHPPSPSRGRTLRPPFAAAGGSDRSASSSWHLRRHAVRAQAHHRHADRGHARPHVVWGVMLLLLGPVWTRYDLRLDLRDLTMIRTMPLSGRAIVSAEIVGVSLLHAITIYAFLAVPVLFAATDRLMRRDLLELVGEPLAGVAHRPAARPRHQPAHLHHSERACAALSRMGAVGHRPTRVRGHGTDHADHRAHRGGRRDRARLSAPARRRHAVHRAAWLGSWGTPVAALVVLLCLLAEVMPIWMALGTVFDRTEPGDVPGQRA